jgi:hypothetical protein
LKNIFDPILFPTSFGSSALLASKFLEDQEWEISENDYASLEKLPKLKDELIEDLYYNENTYRKAINSGLIDFLSMWV